jgi:hypothetical protein
VTPDAVLSAGDGAIATEAQLDALLESVVTRVVAGSELARSDPPTGLEEVDVTVWLRCGKRWKGAGHQPQDRQGARLTIPPSVSRGPMR